MLHLTSPVAPFRDALSAAAKAAPARSPKPILQNVYLDASDDGRPVSFLATDLEVGLRVNLPGADVLSPGRCILPAGRLGEALATLPKAAVLDLSVDESGISVGVAEAGWKCRLAAEDPDLFPAGGWGDAAKPFAEVAGADLRRAIRRTIPATDITSTRYALGGCLFELGESSPPSIHVVATDGRRLVRVTIPADLTDAEPDDAGPPPPASPVLSVKFLKRLGDLIDEDETVSLRLESNRAMIARQSGWEAYGRLVEGRFPRYRDVFPDESTVRVRAVVHSAEMLAAIGRVAAIATSDESRGVDVEFRQDGFLGCVAISGTAADRGDSSGHAGAEFVGPSGEAVAGPEDGVSLTLDPRYIMDILGSDAPEMIRFDAIDHKSALVFMSDDGLYGCCMPLTRDR